MEVFLPLYRSSRRWSDRIKKLDLPLFPRYLFVRMEAARQRIVVDSPGVWGRTNILAPEEDFSTTELYGVVDQALDQLPAPLGQLIQLVDIDRLSVADAADALRLSPDDATSALHRARVHVRGAIDGFVA